MKVNGASSLAPAAASVRLKTLMAGVGLTSFRALSREAGVSEWAVQQLRRGKLLQMRLEVVHKLAIALQLSTVDLIQQFQANPVTVETAPPQSDRDRIAELEAEYQRLQAHLAEHATQLRQRLQREALATLEPWLLQWPTVVHAVAKNPDLPAIRLLPLVQPMMDLLAEWEVQAIASVGTEVDYDPHLHTLMEGVAQPGDRVRVRYGGYTQRDTLLYRAKVSPVN